MKSTAKLIWNEWFRDDQGITRPFVKNPYNYSREADSDRTGLECKDPHLAKQEFAKESDINYIAERYGLTGELPEIQQLPTYADYSGIFDYQSAMNQVLEARDQFMQLPAKVRARFHNDPQELLTFLEDKDNRAEAELLGLVVKNPAQDVPQSSKGDATPGGKDPDAPSSDLPPEPPTTKDKKSKN